MRDCTCAQRPRDAAVQQVRNVYTARQEGQMNLRVFLIVAAAEVLVAVIAGVGLPLAKRRLAARAAAYRRSAASRVLRLND